MYTIQALWTMARDKTDIVIVLLRNDANAILGLEMERVRENELNAGMNSMLDLGDLTLDLVKLANGHGVPADPRGSRGGVSSAIRGLPVRERAASDPVPGRHAKVARAGELRSQQPLRFKRA